MVYGPFVAVEFLTVTDAQAAVSGDSLATVLAAARLSLLAACTSTCLVRLPRRRHPASGAVARHLAQPTRVTARTPLTWHAQARRGQWSKLKRDSQTELSGTATLA